VHRTLRSCALDCSNRATRSAYIPLAGSSTTYDLSQRRSRTLGSFGSGGRQPWKASARILLAKASLRQSTPENAPEDKGELYRGVSSPYRGRTFGLDRDAYHKHCKQKRHTRGYEDRNSSRIMHDFGGKSSQDRQANLMV
jgi:hypothetical protein